MNNHLDTVFQLAVNSISRNIPASQFMNFYNEYFNEKYGSIMNSGDDSLQQEEKLNVFKAIMLDLLKLLGTGNSILAAEYVVEVLFTNYNSDLVKMLLPQILNIDNSRIIIHFFSRSSLFFGQLNNKLIIDQANDDIGSVIIPSLLSKCNSVDNQLIVAISKFLYNILKVVKGTVKMNKDFNKEDLNLMLKKLGNTNKILYRQISSQVELKLEYDMFSRLPSDVQSLATVTSPSVLSTKSPKYTPSPIESSKHLASPISKYQDVKLIRYCKNLWLNNKIHNFSTMDPGFLDKYYAIGNIITNDHKLVNQSLAPKLSDLIETSFTCFAQFISNKLYHQKNSNFTLLERKWTIFLTKRIPLLVHQYCSTEPQVVVTALENIDDKVVNVIKSYYSAKDESKNQNEDLFDDFPSTNLDIRHEFLKNLIALKLQPSTVLNEFLREEQIADIKILQINDTIVLKNPQGIYEPIKDISRFVHQSLDSLDNEMLFNDKNELVLSSDNGLIQLFQNFDSIAPTKQRDISKLLRSSLSTFLTNCDGRRLSKLFGLLTLNIGHSLTVIMCYIHPKSLLDIAIKFIDLVWEEKSHKLNDNITDDSEFESMSRFSHFTTVLVFIIHSVKTYDIKLENLIAQPSKSFVLKYVFELGEIPNDLKLDNLDSLQATTVFQELCRDLFINGSISDQLMKSINVKALSRLVPYIFKQSLILSHNNSLTNIKMIINGFDYFLQPFMIIGLINIVFWLGQFCTTIRSTEYSSHFKQQLFDILHCILVPSDLSFDAKSLHFTILKLNCVELLKVLKMFRIQSQSNYGIYSSQSESDPKLESLITKLELIVSTSYIYGIDPKIINSANSFSQSQLSHHTFFITESLPMNKIMANQINSFWNLHSSTYYNFDYLLELIRLVNPLKFLNDVLQTLQYKVSVHGIPGTKNKLNSSAMDQILNYLLYFMVMCDIQDEDGRVALLHVFQSNSDLSSDSNVHSPCLETEKKFESNDEDFDMLFGESFSGAFEDNSNIDSTIEQPKEVSFVSSPLVRFQNSFGLLLYFTKIDKTNAYSMGQLSDEDYNSFITLHTRYYEILKGISI